MAASRRGCRATESQADGLGELFLPLPVKSCVPFDRYSRPRSATPVVVQETQDCLHGEAALLRPVPGQGVGFRKTGAPHIRLAVGKSKRACPRAGCGKTASPVRCGGFGNESVGEVLKAPPADRGENRQTESNVTASHLLYRQISTPRYTPTS